MKRLLSLVLAFVLVLTLAACNQSVSDPADGDTTGETAGGTAFIKPENYASVLLVTINPQFRLYLDEAGTVLAVEAVNQDAEAIKEEVSFENVNYETAVEQIVTKANEKGYIKADAVIQVQVTESKSTQVNTADVLEKATAAVNQTATKLELNVEVKTEDETVTTPDPEEPTQEPTQPPVEEPTQGTEATEPTEETEPVHEHSYSKATCTKPKTCACGKTEGKALGHDYKAGTCSRCGAKDPDYVSYTAVTKKDGSWSAKYLSGGILYKAKLKLYGTAEDLGVSAGLGDPLSSLPEEVQEDMKQDCEQYNGEYYYFGKGTGDGLASVKEEGTAVTVMDLSGNKLVLTRTAEGKLKVKSCTAEFSELGKIPVGTVFEFASN